MELSQLVQILRRRWALGVFSFVVVLAIGALAAFAPTPSYTATATLSAQPNLNSVQFGQVQVVDFLLPTLAKQVQSDSFRRKVNASFAGGPPTRAYHVAAKSTPGTGLFAISVTSHSQGAVAALANAFAASLLQNATTANMLTLTAIDPASTPTSPSAPAKTIILAGAMILGVIAAICMPLLANSLRRRFENAEEVRKRFATSVLGQLPRLKWPKGAQASRQILQQFDDPASAEAFQRLRANLELVLFGEEPKAIAITSTKNGEGKSTIAAVLGMALAAAGSGVVLIDADLRRPTLHQKLGELAGPGLAEADPSRPGQLRLTKTRQPGLDFLPSGTPSRHPADVITAALPGVIDEVQRSRRLVIVDAPPLNGVAETGLIAAIAGSVILVVDARKYNEEAMEQAIAQLHQSGARLLGVVINRVKMTREQRNLYGYYAADPGEPSRVAAGIAAVGSELEPRGFARRWRK